MHAGGRHAAQPQIFARPSVLLALYLIAALALQATSFGDTDRHADEMFYFLVGQRMHEGLLPYVDVWDRKPFGLFLIYYLIAGVSSSVWSYQIVACLFVAATALVIARLAAYWSDWRGGLFAGLVYIVAIQPFEGASGQAPDFYNLFIASAALLVVHERDRFALQSAPSWRSWGAMALCGVAITVKQTALFESIFLGLMILAGLHRAAVPRGTILRVGIVSCAIGALPTLAIAFAYALAGHWPEYWHAMVLSNLARAPAPADELAIRAVGLALRLAIVAALALAGILGSEGRARAFLAGWVLAALGGVVVIPAFSVHYVLPLLVPLAVAAGLFLGRSHLALLYSALLASYALFWNSPDHRATKRASTAAMAELAGLIGRHDGGGGLLVFDGPVYLYAMTGKALLTPLAFPYHLNHGVENNVSHLDTHAEVDRVLAGRPGVVVLARWPRSFPVNGYARARVLDYVRAHCRLVKLVPLPEGPTVFEMAVWGDCAKAISFQHRPAGAA